MVSWQLSCYRCFARAAHPVSAITLSETAFPARIMDSDDGKKLTCDQACERKTAENGFHSRPPRDRSRFHLFESLVAGWDVELGNGPNPAMPSGVL
jgi:hypothetical protein